MTATQALQHPWLNKFPEETKWESNILAKLQNPDRSLKAAVSKIVQQSKKSKAKFALMKSLMDMIPSSEWTSLVPIAELDEIDLANYIAGLSVKNIQVVRKKILFVGN